MTILVRSSDLNAWPIVGTAYLVPHIHWPQDFPAHPWIPIYGDKHTDFDEENIEHVHVDPRFLTSAQEADFATIWRSLAQYHHIFALRLSKHSDGVKAALGLAPPVLPTFEPRWLPRICRYERVEWDVNGAGDADYHASEDDRVQAMRFIENVSEGQTIRAIVTDDGRPRCPHQRFDLTAVWDGRSETVRCPLHGLEVDVSRCTARSGSQPSMPSKARHDP